MDEIDEKIMFELIEIDLKKIDIAKVINKIIDSIG